MKVLSNLFIVVIGLLLTMSILSSNPDSNQSLVYNAALKVFNGNVLMAQVTLAQAIQESNLLSTPSTLASKYNNLFGIKGSGTKGSVGLMTTEYVNGKPEEVRQNFAWNNSVEDSIQQRKNLLEHGTKDFPTRYQPVLHATTFEQAANALVAGGYASDPTYAQSLISVYNTYIKDKFQ